MAKQSKAEVSLVIRTKDINSACTVIARQWQSHNEAIQKKIVIASERSERGNPHPMFITK